MSDQTIPENLRHLVGEISVKDLQRLVEMERGAAVPPVAKSIGTYQTRPTPSVEGSGLRKPAALAEPAEEAMDYLPRADDIDLRKLRPVVEEKQKKEEDGFQLPSVDDVMVASTVSVLGVGVVLENSYHQLRSAKRAFDSQPRVVRGIELIFIGTVILTLVGFFVGGEVKAYIKAHEGPFLAEALAAPYNMEQQAIPAENINAVQLIPARIGKFQRTSQPITRDYSSSPTNQCLLGLGYHKSVINPPLCTRTVGAVSVGSGRYQDSWKSIDLVITHFTNNTAAERTMFELLHHARQFGQVGNFSIGTGSVDFIYSSVYGWYTFTWSHGSWVFSISGQALSYVEDAAKNFKSLPMDTTLVKSGA